MAHVMNFEPSLEPQESDQLSIREASEMLGSSPSYVYTLIKEGRLKAVNLNRGTDRRSKWVVKKEHVEEFLRGVRGEDP